MVDGIVTLVAYSEQVLFKKKKINGQIMFTPARLPLDF